MNSLLRKYTKASFALALPALLAIGLEANAQTPIAHWTFDDGINNYDLTTADDIANGNDAIWQDVTDGIPNGLSYGAGPIGAAAVLGAGSQTQFFEIASIPQLNGIAPVPFGTPVGGEGITLSAWVNVNPGVGGYDGILMSRTVTQETAGGTSDAIHNYGIARETGPSRIDGRIGTFNQVDSSTGADPDSIIPGTWHHVVLVWGNIEGVFDVNLASTWANMRLYVDGVIEDESASTSGIFEIVSSGTWAIGNDFCCDPGFDRQFNGMLDDVAIFGSALSDTEVTTLYNNGLAGIDASGNATGELLDGDVNGDQMVLIDDFHIIRDALGTTVNGRILGDLTGDRNVDLDDFQQWLNAASPALASEALAIMSSGSVPEPGSAALIGLSLAAYGFVRRTKRF